MKLLVTGGAGFVGSHIVDLCITHGYEVAIIDNLWREGGGKKKNIHPQARFFQADVTDSGTLKQVFDEFQPDVVNHQAAQHSVAFSTRNPHLDAKINILGLINLLEQCTRVGTRKFIFASSCATYGTPTCLPLDEEAAQRPESPYGITKMTAEHYLRYWREAYDLNYTILRYGNVYGPRQDPNGEAGVIAIFAKRILSHQPVRIDWDGEQSKDYVHVEDVARANLLAVTKGDNEVFCIGAGKPISINNIFHTLAKTIGYTPNIIHAPKRPGDIYQAYYSISRAERILGWQPLVPFDEGIKTTVAAYAATIMES